MGRSNRVLFPPISLLKRKRHLNAHSKSSVMIQSIALTKRYEDGRLALDHVHFTVNPGEVYCLLGANAAGKSTLLNLLLNFIQPTSGSALIDGIDCTLKPMEARKRVSYLPGNLMLSPDLTAQQNLRYLVGISGNRRVPGQALRMAMREVGLPELAFRQRARELPLEMRLKLGVALAMIRETPALLADEPTYGLDPRATVDLMALLLKLKKRGTAVLLCTRDEFLARRYGDRIGILKQGVFILERSRTELREDDLAQLHNG
jgi:ABC-2 type transport system ATP-binding protein